MENHKHIAELPLFFILGRTRSGTTMLRSMLDAHPNILVPPEFPVLTCVRNMQKSLWAEKEIDQFVVKVGRCYKFSYMKITTDALRDRLLEYYKEKGSINLHIALKILDLFYISPFEKDEILQLGNKNPLYSLHVEKIRVFFPNSKFIFIRRHLLSVMESIENVNFELRWPAFIAWRWKKAIRKSFRAKQKLPEMCFLIRYEDLTKNPEQNLRGICAFLSVPFNEAIVQFNDEARLKKVYGDELVGVHSSLLLKPQNALIKKWDEDYSFRQKIAIAWAGKSLAKAGYSRRKFPRFFYYILGVPSVFTAFSIQFISRALNFISFGRFSPHLIIVLPQILYRKKGKK